MINGFNSQPRDVEREQRRRHEINVVRDELARRLPLDRTITHEALQWACERMVGGPLEGLGPDGEPSREAAKVRLTHLARQAAALMRAVAELGQRFARGGLDEEFSQATWELWRRFPEHPECFTEADGVPTESAARADLRKRTLLRRLSELQRVKRLEYPEDLAAVAGVREQPFDALSSREFRAWIERRLLPQDWPTWKLAVRAWVFDECQKSMAEGLGISHAALRQRLARFKRDVLVPLGEGWEGTS